MGKHQMTFSDTVVILAAGRGARMQSEIPKVLMTVAGKPIIQHVIDYWTPEIKRFVFVVGYRSDMVIDYLRNHQGNSDFHIIHQAQQKGIADAIYQIKEWVRGRFIVALGDCIQIGQFEYPDNLELGCAVWSNQYQNSLNLSYSARVNWQGYISSICEKPDVTYSGMGTYFLDERVFPYISKTKPSSLRDEVEISDVLQNMINDGRIIKAAWFTGTYINCTTRADIEHANRVLGL
jgi:dTDP-glucose pyrophosphorylase